MRVQLEQFAISLQLVVPGNSQGETLNPGEEIELIPGAQAVIVASVPSTIDSVPSWNWSFSGFGSGSHVDNQYQSIYTYTAPGLAGSTVLQATAKTSNQQTSADIGIEVVASLPTVSITSQSPASVLATAGTTIELDASLSSSLNPSPTYNWSYTQNTPCSIATWVSPPRLDCTITKSLATPFIMTASVCVVFTGTTKQSCSQPLSIRLLAQKQTPTVTLTCTPTNLIAPQTLTCTANVSGGASGSVVFTTNGAVWATATLNSSGNATVSNGLANANQGLYTILASYSGDSVNNAASATTIVRLNPPVSSWLPAVEYLLFAH